MMGRGPRSYDIFEDQTQEGAFERAFTFGASAVSNLDELWTYVPGMDSIQVFAFSFDAQGRQLGIMEYIHTGHTLNEGMALGNSLLVSYARQSGTPVLPESEINQYSFEFFPGTNIEYEYDRTAIFGGVASNGEPDGQGVIVDFVDPKYLFEYGLKPDTGEQIISPTASGILPNFDINTGNSFGTPYDMPIAYGREVQYSFGSGFIITGKVPRGQQVVYRGGGRRRYAYAFAFGVYEGAEMHGQPLPLGQIGPLREDFGQFWTNEDWSKPPGTLQVPIRTGKFDVSMDNNIIVDAEGDNPVNSFGWFILNFGLGSFVPKGTVVTVKNYFPSNFISAFPQFGGGLF